MSSLQINNTVSNLRGRIIQRQDEIIERELQGLHQDDVSRESLYRIRNDYQIPSSVTVDKIIQDVEDVEQEDLYYPYLEWQTPQMLSMREHLLRCLSRAREDARYLEAAQDLVNTFRGMKNFTEGINLQFVLAYTAALNEITNQEPTHTMDIINQAMDITWPDFDDEKFRPDILIFEETNLLHIKAQTYKRLGETAQAIALLRHVLAGMEALPLDDRDKEQKQAPMLLTLAEYLIDQEDYTQALVVCEQGLAVSQKRSKGPCLPDFVECKAKCLHHLAASQTDTQRWAGLAYFALLMQRRSNQAAAFLTHAKEHLGIPINTYGADQLALPLPPLQTNYGSAFPFSKSDPEKNPDEPRQMAGRIIQHFRMEMKITQKELCRGICSQNRLSKIESGEAQGTVWELEALMQRLGRDIDRYFNTLIPKHEFEQKQKRDAASALLANLKYDEAEVLINELDDMQPEVAGKKVNKNAFAYYTTNQQFIATARISLLIRRNKKTPEHYDMLQKALEITLGKFNLRDVRNTRHTYHELTILNKMAIYLCSQEKTHSKGMRLYEDILECMDTYYVDDVEKARLYPWILFSYSTYLGRAGELEEMLQLAEVGEVMALNLHLNRQIPGFLANKAHYLLKGKEPDKEKSLALLAISYYSDMLAGRLAYVKSGAAYAKEHFGIEFD